MDPFRRRDHRDLLKSRIIHQQGQDARVLEAKSLISCAFMTPRDRQRLAAKQPSLVTFAFPTREI
jgi:hypothetical protein